MDSQRTVTYSLKGTVSIEVYARALEQFAALLYALSNEIAATSNIHWRIERLEAGSATTTAGAVTDDIEALQRVVVAYTSVGQYLQHNQPIPYSSEVVEHATALTAFIDSDVTAVEFSGGDMIWTITEARAEPADLRERKQRAWGSVTGIIKTISLRRGLSVSLYDTLFDKAVECHFDGDSETNQEIVRNAWGKLVTVTGRVERDPDNGRPVRIVNIRTISPVEPVVPGQYKQTLGILPWPNLDERPEDVIRRLRDAQ